MKRRCEVCGKLIFKSEDIDSELCRECEENMEIDELRYKYLGGIE